VWEFRRSGPQGRVQVGLLKNEIMKSPRPRCFNNVFQVNPVDQVSRISRLKLDSNTKYPRPTHTLHSDRTFYSNVHYVES
jgi:hypothetical protein